MSEVLSTKELELKAFRSTFQDGLWDIYLGILLFLMGGGIGLVKIFTLNIVTIHVTLAVVAVITVTGFILGKKHITVPRLGMVKFGPERRAKLRKVRLWLSLSALVGLAVLVSFRFISRIEGIPSWLIPLGLFGIMSVVVFSLGAYYMDYSRAYLYGWCYALAFPAGILLDSYTYLGFLISYLIFSGIMITPGIVLLVRFLRDYPIPVGELGGAAE